MNNIDTGNQSGGLKPEHGGSTPVKSGGVSNLSSGSDDNKPIAESTKDKNAPQAFAQNPESTPAPGNGEDEGESSGDEVTAQY